MQIRLDEIIVENFKRIETLSIDLKPITALVGGMACHTGSVDQRMHQLAGGSTQASDARVYSITEHLRTPEWSSAFDPQLVG